MSREVAFPKAEDSWHDVVAARVVGADLRPLGRVQRALEQRAEDGRLDAAPVLHGRGAEELDLVALQWQGRVAWLRVAVCAGGAWSGCWVPWFAERSGATTFGDV